MYVLRGFPRPVIVYLSMHLEFLTTAVNLADSVETRYDSLLRKRVNYCKRGEGITRLPESFSAVIEI